MNEKQEKRIQEAFKQITMILEDKSKELTLIEILGILESVKSYFNNLAFYKTHYDFMQELRKRDDIDIEEKF